MAAGVTSEAVRRDLPWIQSPNLRYIMPTMKFYRSDMIAGEFSRLYVMTTVASIYAVSCTLVEVCLHANHIAIRRP
jgi:hypothetical protein